MMFFGVVPVSWWTVPVLVVGLAATAVGGRRLAERTGWRVVPTLVALAALTAVLALTLTPSTRGHAHTFGSGSCLAAFQTDELHAVTEIAEGGQLESQLNALLLVPLGIAAMLAVRRFRIPLLTVTLLPVLIELIQGVLPGRICSLSDLLLNAGGGALGVALAALAIRRGSRVSANPPG